MKSRLITSILLLALSLPMFAQTRVSGVVNDNIGPLIGASIIEKGTVNGTVTDVNGSFSLTVKPGATLVFSSIGYKNQEIAIGNQTRFTVLMEEDTEMLEETVVVGYGVQKKSDVTGSVASVNTEQMLRRSPVDIAQGLQGAAAGVVITQSGGDPNGGYSIRIRGIATMQGNTNPLWVVDGVQYGTHSNLGWLDPNDVESIEILKDASATAIYGARGANGVILVTTKKGKAGKVRLDANVDLGISTYSNPLKMADLDLWLDAYRMAVANDGKQPFTAFNGSYDDQLNEINWQDVMSQTSFRQKYNISLSGGTENARTSASIGYIDNNGIIVKTWNKRFTFRLSSDFAPTKWLKVGFTTNFNTSKGESGGNMISYARIVPTMDYVDENTGKLVNVPVVYDDGSFGHFTWQNDVSFSAGKYQSNPYADKFHSSFKKDWDNDNANAYNSAYAEVTFMKGLTFRSNVNFDYGGSTSWSYSPKYIGSQYDYIQLSGQEPQDGFSTSGSSSTTLGIENYLTYDKEFGKNHITAMVGQSASKTHGESASGSTKDLTFPFLRGFYSTDSKAYNDGGGGPSISSRFLSYFARLNYSYGGKYLFTATVRRDGSSNFGKDNRWGTFPSFSAAWNMANEEFIKNLGVFSTLKLRAGWGQTGNANVSATASVPQLSVSGITFDTFDSNHDYTQRVGIAQTSEIDTGLQWETSVQTNVGIDMGFFNNSITFTLDYYLRNTRDLILSKSIRPSAGFSSITTNFGSIKNSGFEFALGYKKQFNRDWFFSASLTGSTNKNEAIDIGTGSTSSGPTGSSWENKQVCYNGLPLGTYQGYRVDYIFQSQDEIDALNAAAVEKYGKGSYWDKATTAPGDFKYKDLNGDGRITTADKEYLGDGFPKLNYGLNLSVTYKNWDASAFIYGVFGQKILSWSKCYLTAINNENEGYFNLLADVVNNSWTPERGTSATYPRITRDDMSYNKRVSDFFVENGNYLKISNFQIGYTFNNISWLNRARAYFSVQNLACISPYNKYGDPEISGGVSTQGYDSGKYPFPRTFVFGIQIGL